jgi:hypothetical protein
MKVKLSEPQFLFLKNGFLEKRNDINYKYSAKRGFIILVLEDDFADQIRDWAGERLQEVGFDENYEPTMEGLILEDLIDIFEI